MIELILALHIALPQASAPQDHTTNHRASGQTPFVPTPATSQPDLAEFTSVHDCGDSRARITVRRIAEPWTQGTSAKLEVVEYSDQRGAASPAELARWNSWIGDIYWWGGYRVLCADSTGVSGFTVIFSDLPATNHGSVMVTWLNGRMYRQPLTADQFELVNQWNADAENED